MGTIRGLTAGCLPLWQTSIWTKATNRAVQQEPKKSAVTKTYHQGITPRGRLSKAEAKSQRLEDAQ